jgi:ectoine hydroxylase-related dioxygenase (phytanoyl-CoA dioxygenase family)
MDPGDAFIVLSACFHSGSANATADEERLAYSIFFTKGWMRQEKINTLPMILRRLRNFRNGFKSGLGMDLAGHF